jgi:hypothetical protein
VAEERCAVLFALPHDRATFDAVVRRDILQDYRGLLLWGDAYEAVWSDRYERIVAAAADLAQVAEAMGATVVTRATLPDVSRSAALHDVVVLIGHWRGWVVSEPDFLVNAHDVVVRLRAAGLADIVPRRLVDFVRRRTRMPDCRELARRMNEALEQGRLLEHGEAHAICAVDHPALKAALGRVQLDALLDGVLMPGNRLELCDGLHRPETFESALPGQFRGVLDLATCSSVLLATWIKMRRDDAVQVAHTMDQVDPLMCMIAIAETLRLVKAGAGPYTRARLDVESRLIDIREHLKTEIGPR